MHAPRSKEFDPKASGADAILQVIVLYVDNLLGTRLEAQGISCSRRDEISPRTHRAIVADHPLIVNVCLKRPITKITRTTIAERYPEVRDSELERQLVLYERAGFEGSIRIFCIQF